MEALPFVIELIYDNSRITEIEYWNFQSITSLIVAMWLKQVLSIYTHPLFLSRLVFISFPLLLAYVWYQGKPWNWSYRILS
jgi:hypothetical protein